MSHPPARTLTARALLALTALAITAAPGAVFAEGDPAAAEIPAPTDPGPAATDPEARFAPVTEHIFGGEEVGGRTLGPDGAWVNSRRGGPAGSLIRIRTTFRAELLQSAQDI